jgi:hypothetical protein
MNQIYERMSKVMSEIDAIGKDQNNRQQGFSYRGIDDVMNSLHSIMAKHEVFVMPELVNAIREERKTKSGGVLIYSICDYKFTFNTVDGSSVSCVVRGEGMDSGDKASNKAISIALKYALVQAFMIPTEDMVDPDATTPEQTEPTVEINWQFHEKNLDKMKTEQEVKDYFVGLGSHPDRKSWTSEQLDDFTNLKEKYIASVKIKTTFQENNNEQ